jgi:hypothetical protein
MIRVWTWRFHEMNLKFCLYVGFWRSWKQRKSEEVFLMVRVRTYPRMLCTAFTRSHPSLVDLRHPLTYAHRLRDSFVPFLRIVACPCLLSRLGGCFFWAIPCSANFAGSTCGTAEHQPGASAVTLSGFVTRLDSC